MARNAAGEPFDPFDVVDRLVRSYPVVYVVDLDGIEKGVPQLDYLQELSRDATIWANAGVRTADQAIDVLVAGAARAVLSSSLLGGSKEVKRAWRLSTDLVFELELSEPGPTLRLRGDWPVATLQEVSGLVREVGVTDLIVSPRGVDVDWTVVRELASAGPVWVDGSFRAEEAPRLMESGAAGGIFHLNGLLAEETTERAGADAPLRSRDAR